MMNCIGQTEVFDEFQTGLPSVLKMNVMSVGDIKAASFNLRYIVPLVIPVTPSEVESVPSLHRFS